jgi:Skp family chaperone for outer membrane proteins
MLGKISLAISSILAIAVMYLLLKSPSGKTNTATQVEVAPAFTSEGGPRATVVAILNGDSLNSKYDFIVEKSKELDMKMRGAEQRVQSEFGPRQAEYEKAMRYAQENPNMPESEMMALQKSIEQLQREMDAIQEKEVGALQKKEVALQEELLRRVNAYLDKFSKEKGIDFVINKQSEFQMVLYGNPDFDVTSEVIAGLNEEYRIEKEGNKP